MEVREELRLDPLEAFEPEHPLRAEERVDPMRGLARVLELEGPGSFALACECGGPGALRLEVRGAHETLWSYHLRHARGGQFRRCKACGATYALAGRLGGVGLPDVVDLDRIDLERCTPLSPIACTLLDGANYRDDALWERSAEAIRQAHLLHRFEPDERRRIGWELRCFLRVDYLEALAEGPVVAEELLAEAWITRGWLQKRKQDEIRAIAWEMGVERFPPHSRLFRIENGGGFVDWGSPEAKPEPLKLTPPGSSPWVIPAALKERRADERASPRDQAPLPRLGPGAPG